MFLVALGAMTLQAEAATQYLTCRMTDYSGAKLNGTFVGGSDDHLLAISTMIPTQARHEIDGITARLDGTGMIGSVEHGGSRIVLKYKGHSETFGEVRITYTYHVNNGIMTARALLQRPQNAARVDRIAGTCALS